MVSDPNCTNGSFYERHPNFREDYFALGFYTQRYLNPIWILLGIFGNTLSFIIWSRPRFRRDNSSAIYLAIISISDLLQLLLFVVHYLYMSWHIFTVHKVNGLCQIYNVLQIFFQFYSIPLVFAFTLERWVSICYPFQRERWCNPRRSAIASVLLAIFVFCFSSGQFFVWKVVDDHCMFQDKVFGSLTDVYFYLVDLIFSASLPALILLFNILVIKELRRITMASRKYAPCAPIPQPIPQTNNNSATVASADNHEENGTSKPLVADDKPKGDCGRRNRSIFRSSTTEPPKERNREASSFRSTTVMLLTVSFYLIICTFTAGAFYVGQFIFTDGPNCMNDEEVEQSAKWKRFFTFQTIKEIVDALALSHYACNFIIYLATGKAFRDEALRLLSCNRIGGQDDLMLTTGTLRGECNGKSIRMHSKKTDHSFVNSQVRS